MENLIKGHVVGIITRTATGKEEIVFEGRNEIDDLLKENFRDSMNANVDFALDNLQATQVDAGDLSASLNGKDGLIIYDGGPTITNALGFMASAVHPTTPSGNFFRQWQGVYQNLSGGDETPINANIGLGYTHSGGAAFSDPYALIAISGVTLLNNDIITINWKITVG